MTLSHATIDFAGIQIDTFLTEDEQAYATLTSIGKGLGYSRQTTQDWLERTGNISQGIPVKVGIRNKAGTAYPVNVIGDFLDYRIGVTDDAQVKALYSATFRADLISDIKRANLVSVTQAEQNTLRAEIRMDLVRDYAKLDRTKKSSYQAQVTFIAEATQEEKDLAFDLRFLDNERRVVGKLLASRTKLDEDELHRYNLALSCIESTKVRLEAQGVSC